MDPKLQSLYLQLETIDNQLEYGNLNFLRQQAYYQKRKTIVLQINNLEQDIKLLYGNFRQN